jgi:transcriptional regulator with XRE-family HTH domain
VIQMIDMAPRLVAARERAGLGQRELGRETGIPQAAISRIESGQRAPKADEVIRLAWALGCTVEELTGTSPVRARTRFAARAAAEADMAAMRAELLHHLELDAYLEGQGIAQPS